MIRWETLNEPGGDRSGYEKDPKEVQVEQCLELYQRALRLHQKGRVEDAKQLYKQLVESEVMQEEVLVGESDGNITTQSKPVALLQYLVYKNYASIVEEDDKKLPQRQDGQALQYYIKAVNVDPTDYNLWHRIGLLARSESRLRLARFAFESALAPATRRSGVIAAAIIATEKETAVDGKVARPGREDRGRAQSVTLEEVEPMQLGPVQWWCLEELCNVLYDIGDFSTCLYYVDIALAIHPDFERGEWLKREIIRWEGAGLSGLAKAVSAAERTSSEMERHPLVSGLFMTTPQPPSSFALENQTWGGLGRLLLDVYDMVERSKDSLIDDYAAQTPLMFLNRRIEITLPVQAPIISTMSTADSSAATTGADVLSSGMTQTKSAASDNVDVDERSGGDSKMETSRSVIGLEESEPMVVDEDMGVLAAPTRKRKGSEEETEEKAEERRSLRTSKRVRDKLDHEELAKRRREDEERAFVTKVDAVLSKFSMSLACPGRIGIKQGQDEEEREEVYGRDEVTQFMEWMGSKVAAMGAGPGEDLSADIKAGGGTRQPTSIKRQYDIFTSRTGTDGSTFKEPLENFSALSDFIDDTNASNSGILDYLCRYVKRLIISNTVPGGNIVIKPTDSSGGRSGSLSEAAIKVLADVVVRLGEHLMRTMNSDLGCAGETDAMEIDDDSQEMADVDDKNQGIPEIGSKSSSEVMEYALAIAELVLDGAIALVISEAVQGEHRSLVSGHDTRGGRRSLGDAAREQKMAIERMLAVTRRWVTLFEREVERAGEGQALWLLKSDSSEEERESVNGALEAELLCDISEREHKNLVRFFWIQARLQQAEENVDAALHFLRLCRRLLNDRNCVVILSSCCYDSVISLAIIDARIQAIETQRYIVDADKRFLEKDHVGVVERLESLFSGCKPSNSSGANDSTVSSGTAPLKRSIEEKMRLIGMLADAYRALGQADKLWACYNHILGDVVRMLLWSGSEAMANDKAETDFWRSMKLLRTIFGEFMTSLETETGKDWISTLPGPERNSLIASVCVVLRSCLTYMFHHPAFALLLSADTEPSSPQGTSSKILSTVTIRSWVLFFLFVRSLEREQQPATSESVEEPAAIMGIGCGTIEETDAKSVGGVQGREDVDGDIEEGSSRPLMQREGSSSTIKDATSASSRVKRSKKMTNANMVTELLDIVHDELGQRELCNEDDGIFLRSALKIFADAGRQTHRREIFQCYYCLYNVHLSVDAESPVDHYTDSRPLDREAAAELFELLVPYVSEKVLKGTQMKSDVKDAFDDIVKQFGHPPSTNATLAMNKEVITHYLNSELPFPHTKDFPRWCSLLTTVDVDAERHKIPSIYFQIYFLRGKMFQGQVKNRAKLNQEKIMEDLKNAIEQYLFNLYLNPGHYKGWHALAVCYNGLAEEHLVWNASKIIHQNNQVADLQRKSFHCFIQASKLFGPWHEETGAILDEPSLKALNAEVASHWCEFGYHLYSTTCSPMSMAAFKRRYPKPVMNSDGSRSFVEIAEPKEVHVYKFALMCFRIALQLDDNDWRQHYMIGKCFGKLGRKPKEILDCYKEAIRKTPMRSGQQGQEKILEPIYKLTSSLAKFLLNDVIDSSVVSEYLSYDTYSRTSSEEPEESSAQDNVTKDDQKSNEHRKSVDMTDDKASAFHHIFVKLSQIRGIDKRKWHHRPVYRHAWLHYHVYNDPERAKMELQNLFSLKTTSKQFVNIWKPEFERPGRHFAYVHQYTMFLIKLAKETGDIECLKVLCRKLRKASNVLLKHHEVWVEVYNSYLNVVNTQLALIIESKPAKRIMDYIPKTMFDEHRATIEQDVFAIAPKPSELATMQDLYEVKKLNSRFAPEGDVDELIVQCYAALFVTYATESVRAKLTEGGAGVGEREVKDYILDGSREASDGSGVGTPPQVEPVVPAEAMEATNGASSAVASRLRAAPMTTAHDLLGRAFTVCRAAPSPKARRSSVEENAKYPAIVLNEETVETALVTSYGGGERLV